MSLGNYRYLFTDEVYGVAYLYSLRTAFFSTLICLAIGYPMAYAIARSPKSLQNVLLLVILLPFWTSFLLRVYALEGIIRDNGFLNTVLLHLGLISQPLHIMRTGLAVYIGIVYSYLPFMVLPLFATLEKLDPQLLEAAGDLGSTPRRAFFDVTLPLSLPGVIAGSMLVFIPAVGEFVIPSLLGGPNNLMIGRVLWDEFFGNHDWPVAAAVAIAASCCCSPVRSPSTSTTACASSRAKPRGTPLLARAAHRAVSRHRVPVPADAGADRLLLQRLGAGQRVWGGFSTARHAQLLCTTVRCSRPRSFPWRSRSRLRAAHCCSARSRRSRWCASRAFRDDCCSPAW